MGLQFRKSKVKLSFLKDKETGVVPEAYKIQQLTYPPVTFGQLVAECANSCGVNSSQTKAVIDALVNRLVHYMEIGHGVQMGDFGSFKPVFLSSVAETLEEATADTVKKKKVHFYPGRAFRQMLSDLTVTGASSALSVKEGDSTSAAGGE